MSSATGLLYSSVLTIMLLRSTASSITVDGSDGYSSLRLDDGVDDSSLPLLDWLSSHLPHSREKRFLWMTHEKRIVLPPGTQLVLTPTLAMPLLRYPPPGLDSNMTISTPFTLKFDAMGLTDNENPIGLIPFLMPGLSVAGRKRRRRRSDVPEPSIQPQDVHGGERAFMYEAVEDFLFKMGMDGKACLLRAICETHESPLIGYGLFGEVLELFLTASRSPYSSILFDYVEAERAGREDGECWRYFKDCPKSLFMTTRNKYSEEAQSIVANPELLRKPADSVNEILSM